jgi:Secretion system C-terminal sorting domain
MLRMFTMAVAAAAACSALSFAQLPQAILGPGVGVANFRVPLHVHAGTARTLSADTVYILTGWYFVDSTASIEIPAGTLILGDKESGGTLIISRGAKIHATGTAQSPIVFTSNQPIGSRAPGDWGGVIILGNAPTNKPATQQIEGGFGTIPNTAAQYGGPDSLDNSGELQYSRIEFAGIAFSQDNEINGLTFGGVGRGTSIDHVQVSFANDDSYEFFGGTVDLRYMVDWRCLDDDFDTDFGYAGRGQFMLIKRDPSIFDASASGSSNGFESDNEGSSLYDATPRTKARFSNVTLIGPQNDTSTVVNAKWQYVAMLRRATELSIYNSILIGYPRGIQLRDTLTQRAAIDGRLEIRNTSLQSSSANLLTTSSSPSTGDIPGFSIASWFTTGTGNLGATARNVSDIGLPANAFSLSNSFDAVPSPSSEPATAGTAFDGRLTGDAFFTSVAYRGAFDPTLPMSQQWTASWTNFDPENTSYVTSVRKVENGVPQRFALEQNYPNPFNPSTIIRFSVPKSSFVTLKVYNMLGEEVAALVNETLAAGTFETELKASGLPSGAYFYRLTTDNFTQARKMLLLK